MEKASGVKNVRREIAIVAGPRDWGDNRESWLGKVPRQVRKALKAERETLTFRTVKALWYGEIDEPLKLSKRVERRPPLRINTKTSSEVCVRRTRIFIARTLIALSASLASLALWIAPELRGSK